MIKQIDCKQCSLRCKYYVQLKTAFTTSTMIYASFFICNHDINVVLLTICSFLVCILNTIHDPSSTPNISWSKDLYKLIRSLLLDDMIDSQDYPLSPFKSIISISFNIHILDLNIIPPTNTICSHTMLLPLQHYVFYSIYEEYNNKFIR